MALGRRRPLCRCGLTRAAGTTHRLIRPSPPNDRSSQGPHESGAGRCAPPDKGRKDNVAHSREKCPDISWCAIGSASRPRLFDCAIEQLVIDDLSRLTYVQLTKFKGMGFPKTAPSG